MNIPLNIDIQQILLHLLNFAILAVGLYLLLFRPVKNFMNQRQEHYAAMEQEAISKVENAEKMEKEYQQRLDAAAEEIQKQKALEAARMEAAAQSIEEDAKAQARKILADARKEGEAQRVKILEDAGKEIAAMVVSAAEKLMAQNSDPKTEAALYDQFLKEAEKGTEHEDNA